MPKRASGSKGARFPAGNLAHGGGHGCCLQSGRGRRSESVVRTVWRWIVRSLGRLFNLASLPGFVRQGIYRSRLGEKIRVRVSPMFTEISVKGISVFFDRLTGRFDGIGVTPARYRAGAGVESAPAPEPLEPTGPSAPRSRIADSDTD